MAESELLKAGMALAVTATVLGQVASKWTAQRARERLVAEVTREAGKQLRPDEAERLVVAIRGSGEGPPLATSVSRSVDDAPQVSHKLVERLVDSYHQQALEQARFQFWFSVSAAVVGFAWILGAGAMAMTEQNPAGFAKVIPGVVINAVALLFFKQAEQTRQRATALYDRLRTDNLNTQAIEIVSSIEDTTLRSAVRAQLALHIVGMAAGAFDVGRFLAVAAPASDQPRAASSGTPLDGEQTNDPRALKVASGGKP